MGQTFGKSTWKGSAQRIRAAPDGSSVVLSETPLIAQATRLTLLQIDGGVRDLGTWSSVTGYSYGPDGREVWVSGDRDGSGPVLWAVSLNGEARVLARFPGEPVLHDVAPDGRALISMVERRLHTIAVIDGREQDLTWLSASGVRGITDDGRTIAFEDVSDRPGAARSVWIRTIDGAPAMRLGEGRPLEIAPKGDLVAATITGPPAKLVLYPTGPGDQRIVAEAAYDYLAASFLPEGDKLFFVETPSATHMDMPFTLKVADVRSGTITPLTSDLGAVHVRHAVAPDGRTVLLKRQGGAFFVVPIGAERWQWDAAEAIPGLAEPDFIRRWTPSGVYVMRFEPRTLRIDRVEIPSGKRTTWKQLAPTDLAGVDSPGTGGFFAVTPDGRACAYSYERSLSTLYLVQGLR